jgi:hypothetical protein
MDFISDRRASRRPRAEVVNDYEQALSLQMYTIPPVECISLQEFEDLAVERVKGTIFHNCRVL